MNYNKRKYKDHETFSNFVENSNKKNKESTFDKNLNRIIFNFENIKINKRKNEEILEHIPKKCRLKYSKDDTIINYNNIFYPIKDSMQDNIITEDKKKKRKNNNEIDIEIDFIQNKKNNTINIEHINDNNYDFDPEYYSEKTYMKHNVNSMFTYII